MVSDIFAGCHKQALYGERHFAECHRAECRYAECRGALNLARKINNQQIKLVH